MGTWVTAPSFGHAVVIVLMAAVAWRIVSRSCHCDRIRCDAGHASL